MARGGLPIVLSELVRPQTPIFFNSIFKLIFNKRSLSKWTFISFPITFLVVFRKKWPISDIINVVSRGDSFNDNELPRHWSPTVPSAATTTEQRFWQREILQQQKKNIWNNLKILIDLIIENWIKIYSRNAVKVSCSHFFWNLDQHKQELQISGRVNSDGGRARMEAD